MYDESTVPASLKAQTYAEQPQSQNYEAHTGASSDDWCFGCAPADADKCDQTVQKVALQDGGTLRYRWYRFRDQPALRQLAKEFPTKYTEAFLTKLQTTFEGLHEAWGDGTSTEFMRRPKSRPIHMAKLDPAMLVTAPSGKEKGWVPIMLELKHPTASQAGTWSYSNYFAPANNFADGFVSNYKASNWCVVGREM